jgi:hypothetical protein
MGTYYEVRIKVGHGTLGRFETLAEAQKFAWERRAEIGSDLGIIEWRGRSSRWVPFPSQRPA